jgi:hypothetical protein
VAELASGRFVDSAVIASKPSFDPSMTLHYPSKLGRFAKIKIMLHILKWYSLSQGLHVEKQTYINSYLPYPYMDSTYI